MIARRVLLVAPLLALAGAARAASGPIAPITAFGEALLAVMRAGRATPFATREAVLRPAIEAAFDLPTILRSSVGLRWGGMAPSDQVALLAAFTAFTVATWVSNFNSFDGQRIEVAPDTRAVGADQLVTMRIVPTSGDATRLDYVMRETGGAWRAVDILVDGAISRVAIQRSDFRSVLAKGDAALIEMLRQKAADLAAGGT